MVRIGLGRFGSVWGGILGGIARVASGNFPTERALPRATLNSRAELDKADKHADKAEKALSQISVTYNESQGTPIPTGADNGTSLCPL